MSPGPVTPGTGHLTPEQVVLVACLEPMGNATLHVLRAALTSPEFGWGSLVELATEHRISCLVTDTLDGTGLLHLAPRRLARFLQRAQRANHHATRIHRHHAARISSAASQVGLGIAACKGIAVENDLYGGNGAREFGDLDLLVAPEDAAALELLMFNLDYQQHEHSAPIGQPGASEGSRTSSAWSTPTGDIVLPRVVVDVTWAWPCGEARGPDYLRHAVARARPHPLPGLPGSSMPVLSIPDHVALLEDLKASAGAAGRQPKPILDGDRRRLLSHGSRSGIAREMS